MKALRPLQTYVILMVQNKLRSHTRTLKPHKNQCNIHHRDRVTALQRVRSTILLPKVFRKTNLVFLEVVNTTCALILMLINQRFTDANVDMCKNFFHPLECVILTLHFIPLFNFSARTSFSFFCFDIMAYAYKY